MDGRGGCCIARYGGAGLYDRSKVDRIMLRFRPIAPKPAIGGSSGGSNAGSVGHPEIQARSGRGKRKHSKENRVTNGGDCSRRCNNRKRRSENRFGSGGDTAVVTLPLLPETPDQKGFTSSLAMEMKKPQGSFWLNFGGGGGAAAESLNRHAAEQAMVQRLVVVVVVSCVMVECVTETWVDGYGLGRSDEERKTRLAKDTCPGFISDGLGRVTWTNGAFRKLVGVNTLRGGARENMVVWLVMRDGPMIKYPAFTCRVRLQYTCQNRERSSTTLPCDVWRMDGGGFAWRLDVNAALSLGR